MLQREKLIATIARRLMKSTPQVSGNTHLAAAAAGPESPGVKMAAGRDFSTSSSASCVAKFRLTLDTINPYVKEMQYAVRGRMPQEAAKIESAIKKVRETGWCYEVLLSQPPCV